MNIAGCSYDIDMSLVSLRNLLSLKNFHIDQYSILLRSNLSRDHLISLNKTCSIFFSSFMLYWAVLLICLQDCITWYFSRQALPGSARFILSRKNNFVKVEKLFFIELSLFGKVARCFAVFAEGIFPIFDHVTEPKIVFRV
jgi:hypothetical protein